MKKRYDFSQAERGKFFNPDGEFHLPVYLEPDVDRYMRQVAQDKGIDLEQLVNQWLRHNIDMVRSVA